MSDANAVARFGPGERWTGVARAALGEKFDLIAEGLNGRTTCLEDPIEGRYKNGEAFLPVCLESHMPIDLVVIMLGTNDLKARFNVPAEDIAKGVGELVKLIKQAEAGNDAGVPKILIVAPPPMLDHTGEKPEYTPMLAGGLAKSQAFATLYAAIAKEHGTAFLDAGQHIRSSAYDGIHFDPDAQVALGKAIAAAVKTLA